MGKFSTALDKIEQQNTATESTADEWLQTEKIEGVAPEQENLESASSKKSTSNPWNARLFKAINEDTAIPEIFKVLRSRILHPHNTEKSINTIMITSAVPREGKSFITANLGISLAQGLDQHSLLVDCDLRRPTLASILGVSKTMGLVDYLRDDAPLQNLIVKTVIEKLSIIPSGTPPLNPSELLSSVKMMSLSKELAQRYDDRILILDTPPITVAAESGVLAGLVDAVILVVREGVSKKHEIQKTIDTIGKERILGIVYNAKKSNVLDSSYASKYHYYRYDD